MGSMRVRSVFSMLVLLVCFAQQSIGTTYISDLRRSAAQLQMAFDPTKVIPGRYAPGLVSDGRFIDSQDMGVRYCRLFLDGTQLGKPLDYAGTIMLHVFLRYTVHAGMSRVRGTVTAEPLEAVQGSGRQHDVQFDPAIVLHTWDNHTTFRINGTATFPFMPIPVSAVATPLASSFHVPPDSEHLYYITAHGANGSCTFKPEVSPNQLDYRGVNIEINQDTTKEAKDAYIIMSPLYGLRPLTSGNAEKFAVLLGRHIQWHRALGFSRHVFYLRPDDMMLFSIIPAVQHWVSKGYLLLVLWENFKERPDLPLYDQRIVYSHAILAFTGLDAYLAMVDLDEYVMSMRDELGTIQQMSKECNATRLAAGSVLWPQRQLSARGRGRGRHQVRQVLGDATPGAGPGAGGQAAGAVVHTAQGEVQQLAAASAAASAAPASELGVGAPVGTAAGIAGAAATAATLSALTGSELPPGHSAAAQGLGLGPGAHQAQPVNLLVTRYHAMSKSVTWLYPEAETWAATPLKAEHPLLKYSVLNRVRPPVVKPVVKPEFVHTYSTHAASQHVPSTPDPDCLFVLHLKYMFKLRDRRYSSRSGLRRAGFSEDPELEEALKRRASLLSDDWIPAPVPERETVK